VSMSAAGCGLPQGSPLSPILYLFYNSDLFASLRSPNSLSVGWIDDCMALVWVKTEELVVERANELMARVSRWSRTDHSEMDPAKSHILPLTLRTSSRQPLPPILLNNIPIPVSSTTVLLGVTLDTRLTFIPHVESVVAKGLKAAGCLARIASCTKGISFEYTRQLVIVCVLTRTDYASSIWYQPGGSKDKVSALNRVQRVSAKLIAGGFKNTALEALKCEAFLLPTHL
jgi:hypothetical protein